MLLLLYIVVIINIIIIIIIYNSLPDHHLLALQHSFIVTKASPNTLHHMIAEAKEIQEHNAALKKERLEGGGANTANSCDDQTMVLDGSGDAGTLVANRDTSNGYYDYIKGNPATVFLEMIA